jgi:hypothetical protein
MKLAIALCILTGVGLAWGVYRVALWIGYKQVQRIYGRTFREYEGSTNGRRIAS